MSKEISFKERVRMTLIANSHPYKYYFVDYDYLLCSKYFQTRKYFIASAHEDNYLHLTGVKTSLSAKSFFDKCFDGSLTGNDFITETGDLTIDKNLKGSIRRKISVLPDISGIFSADPIIKEDFHKNRIYCTFAAGTTSCTLGYIRTKASYPETLLKGNMVDDGVHLDLILRKKSGAKYFNGFVSGNNNTLFEHFTDISSLISPKMIKVVFNMYYDQYSNYDVISEEDWGKFEYAYISYKNVSNLNDADDLYQSLQEKKANN